MKPIEERVDLAYMHGLRCVEYRTPLSLGLKRSGLIAALGLRYGLVGVAASHHLLLSSDQNEEHDVLCLVQSWPILVEDHARYSLATKVDFEPHPSTFSLIGRLAFRPLQTYLSLYRHLCPLERALVIAKDEFLQDHQSSALEGWSIFARQKARKRFLSAAEQSLKFALHFFERREADLEELPEIALIGE